MKKLTKDERRVLAQTLKKELDKTIDSDFWFIHETDIDELRMEIKDWLAVAPQEIAPCIGFIDAKAYAVRYFKKVFNYDSKQKTLKEIEDEIIYAQLSKDKDSIEDITFTVLENLS